MGAVAIWCMHFVGNYAIVLGNGDAMLQIAYSGLFTFISAVLSIVVLFFAFLAIGAEGLNIERLLLGGTLAGLGVCGMHYLGQAGITNYTPIYRISYFVGAAIIAVVDCILALALFFKFRAAWITSWWSRIICAFILAIGVSGMHWVASIGTDYRLNIGPPPKSTNLHRKYTIITIIALVRYIRASPSALNNTN